MTVARSTGMASTRTSTTSGTVSRLGLRLRKTCVAFGPAAVTNG